MRRLASSLLCLLALAAAPAVALAQSAGDEQYADPFAGQNQSQDNSGSPNSGNSGSGSGSNSNGSGESASGQGSAPSGTTQPQAQAADGSSGSTSGRALAYTGVSTWLMALLGVLAIAGGLLLRASARRPATFTRRTPPLLGRDVRLRPLARRR